MSPEWYRKKRDEFYLAYELAMGVDLIEDATHFFNEYENYSKMAGN